MNRFFRRLMARIKPKPLAAQAFDVSNYWLDLPVTDEVAFEKMREAKALGKAGVMIGTHDVPLATQQSNAGMMSGLWTDVFAYLLFDGDDRRRVTKAAAVPHSGICWIDCEEIGELNPDINTLRHEDVRNMIADAVSDAWSLGLRPAIYTRPEWWRAYTGDCDWFSNYPLWVADPDGVAVLDAAYWAKNRFAGVTMPTWKQYAFNASLAGMNVDLSVGPS